MAEAQRLALTQSQSDIAAIVLKTVPGGVPVTVGSVAEARLAPRARLGAVTHDGKGETIAGVADMQFGLNASEMLGPLKVRIAAVETRLPPGMKSAPSMTAPT